jgi:prevent-host-death family protein
MDHQPRSPAKRINAGKARVNFGQMLNEVYYKGDRFIIERDGRPMAAVIPLSELETLQKIQNQPKPGSDIVKARTRRGPKGKS